LLPVEVADKAEACRQRSLGRPLVPEAVRQRLRELVGADPEASPLEVLRQLREASCARRRPWWE